MRLIPIDSSANLIDSMKVSSFLLSKSKTICVFPEGKRSIENKIGEFKRGTGILIEELNIPALPVYIEGTYKAWPPYRMLPRPSKVTIVFGKPLTREELDNRQRGIDIYKNIVDNIKEEILKLRASCRKTD